MVNTDNCDVLEKLQSLSKRAIKDGQNLANGERNSKDSVRSKTLGRPKGTVKRKSGTSNLVVPLSVSDKQWVQETAQSRGISMTDLITELISKERNRLAKQSSKAGRKDSS